MQLIKNHGGMLLLELAIALGLLGACVLSILKLEAAITWHKSNSLKFSAIAPDVSQNCQLTKIEFGPTVMHCVSASPEVFIQN